MQGGAWVKSYTWVID